MLPRSYYTTILCQTFSPCGKFLVAGNSYGQIAVYNLDRVLNPKPEYLTNVNNNADYIINVEKDIQVCSMTTTQKYLVVGTCGEISGWEWKSIIDSKPTKPSWKIQIPDSRRNIDRPDVNSLWWNDELELLLAGCGDNNIYSFKISEGKLVKTYEGHSDYIHSIQGLNNSMISAGEDGIVKLWDVRSAKSHNEFQPYLDDKLSRPDLGKWIGSATLSEDWIICGGGPKLALWQQRSLHTAAVFDLPDHGIHVSYFYEDRIIAGGAAKHLYQLNYSGEIIVEIPVSATTVYSAVQQSSPFNVFTIAGSSPEIDLCTTFKYKDQTLYFK